MKMMESPKILKDRDFLSEDTRYDVEENQQNSLQILGKNQVLLGSGQLRNTQKDFNITKWSNKNWDFDVFNKYKSIPDSN